MQIGDRTHMDVYSPSTDELAVITDMSRRGKRAKSIEYCMRALSLNKSGFFSSWSVAGHLTIRCAEVHFAWWCANNA